MKLRNANINKTIKSILPALAFLMLFTGVSNRISAQSPFETPLSDKATVSLLTASPGSEVYSQYGHTGIRISDPVRHFDLVFNYGLFDFNSPNFIWRFVKGETDYMVGACSFMDFMLEYQMDNRGVTEQVINLGQKEKEAIWQALVENIQPENRTYRYNFFFNNCATKPRDILTKNIAGNVDYQWKGKFKTLREEVHYYTAQYPWTQFGIDFTLGAQADDPASLRSQQFAPGLLMESFSKAVIKGDSAKIRPLVTETLHPATVDDSLIEKTPWAPGPVLVMWTVFLVVAALSYMEFKKGKTFHWLNAVLFMATGLVGCLIAFLVFFSEHPTTNVNFLLLWLHPFHLVYVLCLIVPAFRKKIAGIYLSINLPFQIFALAGTLFLPQSLHPAVYPILLSLMLRSGLAAFPLLKKKNHA